MCRKSRSMVCCPVSLKTAMWKPSLRSPCDACFNEKIIGIFTFFLRRMQAPTSWIFCIFRFGVASLDTFHQHLSAGHFRPDIKKMRTLVRKAQMKRFVFEEHKRSYELATQLLKSRESLLSNAYKQGFSQQAHRAPSKVSWRKPKPALSKEIVTSRSFKCKTDL